MKPEDAVVISALLGAAALLAATMITGIATKRSKYVETITISRIRWVQELRNEFSEVIHSLFIASTIDNNQERYLPEKLERITTLMKSQHIIRMKLNMSEQISQDIVSLIVNANEQRLAGELDEMNATLAQLVIKCSELLKQEWEKAKFESAGLLGKIYLAWRARKRRRETKRE